VRRVADIFVMFVFGVTAAGGLRDAWSTLRAPELTLLPAVVVAGQVVMAVGGVWAIVALWRNPRRAPLAALVWSVGGLVAGTVATFAWSPFDRNAFLGAGVSVILVACALQWWLRRRLRSTPARTATGS
jgi:hypothetical protein